MAIRVLFYGLGPIGAAVARQVASRKGFQIVGAVDIDRATEFYETIFACKLIPLDLGDLQMRLFPTEEKTTGGALCYHPEFYKPCMDGPLIYLNANPDVQWVLDKVESAGGKIMMPKKQIGNDFGFMAMLADTEGNRIALHSSPVKK